jgi:hypothetical protein
MTIEQNHGPIPHPSSQLPDFFSQRIHSTTGPIAPSLPFNGSLQPALKTNIWASERGGAKAVVIERGYEGVVVENKVVQEIERTTPRDSGK